MTSRRPAPRTTLFVAGFPPSMRARDLAYEFERMGPLVRCDIPALRSPNATPYAFVEYEDPRDAEAAHQDMHGMRFGRHALSIQFAKNAPSSNWRFEGPSRRGPPPADAAPPAPPIRQLDLAEQEEADKAAEERARARAAARERERTRSPGPRRDDSDYPERRSSSRRADNDDDDRRRYDEKERSLAPKDDGYTNGNGMDYSPEQQRESNVPEENPAAQLDGDNDKKTGWSP